MFLDDMFMIVNRISDTSGSCIFRRKIQITLKTEVSRAKENNDKSLRFSSFVWWFQQLYSFLIDLYRFLMFSELVFFFERFNLNGKRMPRGGIEPGSFDGHSEISGG